ncbi:MAG: ImmA/IrrE family metallo-endopeptidase [Planctomycetes bacterium]|nr:ImmA/IrrE family metallo-endopeptidase [Planctomycetota bacterium]
MLATIDVARLALRRAIELRKRLAIPTDHAVCAVDVAEQLDVEVWYKPLPSLAGMYSGGDDPTIVLGSDRPAGYQSSTCAHEIAHHVFGHGTKVDEYIEGAGRSRAQDPEEMLANLFGGHLLMPQAAVTRVFGSRGWSMARPTPEQVFIAAGHLGVGYQTLVHHLRWTIRSIAGPVFDHLVGFQANSIRQTITGRPTSENVFVVDKHWSDRPVDLVVGDLAFLPAGSSIEGNAVEIVDQSADRVTICAVRRGLARAEDARSEWSSFIRVMPKCYDGAAVHRHLEDPDEP